MNQSLCEKRGLLRAVLCKDGTSGGCAPKARHLGLVPTTTTRSRARQTSVAHKRATLYRPLTTVTDCNTLTQKGLEVLTGSYKDRLLQKIVEGLPAERGEEAAVLLALWTIPLRLGFGEFGTARGTARVLPDPWHALQTRYLDCIVKEEERLTPYASAVLAPARSGQPSTHGPAESLQCLAQGMGQRTGGSSASAGKREWASLPAFQQTGQKCW